jgi:transposase
MKQHALRDRGSAHLAAWTGLVPAMNESAGKHSPAGKRHGNKWLTAMLVEAAGLGRPDAQQELSGRQARPAHPAARHGPRPDRGCAFDLGCCYWMLIRDEPYHDLGAEWHERRNNEAHARKLIAQFERLGHTVIIDPAA